MSTFFSRSLAIALFCAPWTFAQNANPPVRSPEIGPDRRVTFRLRAPAASTVVLTGEFLRGSQPLEKDAGGVWSVTVGPVEPEIYTYNFTIDGVRSIDPANPDVKTGSTASTIASILEVHGTQTAFYDPQAVPHGEIRTHWYASKSLGYTRRLTVYTPPGYDANTRARYPVLYLFHGANADETAWTRLGRVNLILDNLLAAGKIRPFVVVMPFGYGAPPGSAPAGRGGSFGTVVAEFSRDLLGDVLPFVDARYRTLTDREHRAIAGLSMGGMESLEIGLNHLDLFSQVGGFSPALTPANFETAFAGLKADPTGANRRLRLLWIGCGKDDSLFQASEAFSQFLTTAGIRHEFSRSEGAHTWIVWRRYLHQFAPMLFQVTEEKVARPIRIILVGDSTVAPQNGWGPGFCAAMAPEVACINLAKNGRSTSSYRAEGSWTAAMKELEDGTNAPTTYVLIQFGHNDQPGKPGRSTDLVTEFPANMRRYASEVKAAGGTPVLVTPLTRRTFKDGKLDNTLAPWADATRKVALEAGVPVLELNSESAALVQKMGPAEADTLALAPPLFDHTHLGEKGATVFGNLVAGELARAVPDLKSYVKLQ
jgi:enterochelin esterase family protein